MIQQFNCQVCGQEDSHGYLKDTRKNVRSSTVRAEKSETAQCTSHMAVQMNEPELYLSNIDVKKNKKVAEEYIA